MDFIKTHIKRTFIYAFPLFVMVFSVCRMAEAEYATNQTIFQKIRYIDGKQEQIIKTVYTVTEVKETKSIGEGVFAKKADGKFIIVRFKVHNKGNAAVPSSPLTDLMLIDNKKRRWDQSLSATGSMRLGTESFGRMEIGADKWIEDTIVFEVPEDVRDYLILLPGGAKVSAVVQADKKKASRPEEDVKRESGEIKPLKEDANKKTVRVITNSATLRSRPSPESKPAAWAVKGMAFDVLGETTDSEGEKWYKVKTSDGREGWIKEIAVNISKPDTAADTPVLKDDVKAEKPLEEKKEKAAEDKIKREPEKKPIIEKGKGKDKAGRKMVKKSLPDLLDEANAFYREGKCEDFINANEKAIEIASKQNNLPVQGRLHYNVAECYTRLNKYDDAQRHLGSAINIGARIKDLELEILALINKSRVFAAKGDRKGSAEIFRATSERANKEIFLNIAVKDYVKALVSMQMAGVLLDMGDNERAKERLEYALMVNHDFKLEENIINTLKSAELQTLTEISGINDMLDEAWAFYEKGDYKGMERVSMTAVEKAKNWAIKEVYSAVIIILRCLS